MGLGWVGVGGGAKGAYGTSDKDLLVVLCWSARSWLETCCLDTFLYRGGGGDKEVLRRIYTQISNRPFVRRR